MVRDKVEEEEWKHHRCVNEHWHKMKKIMMEKKQHKCGMSKKALADIRKHGGGMRRLLKQ